ncbi:MAG TPA: ADOP family duplicated permease [Silvibacterium sp.]|nr:ADOP family duplicated permease [Silvibacterium sp.]
MKITWRSVYRRLAEAFPHEFKMAFGDEMMQAGEDAIGEVAKRHGVPGLIGLVGDLAIRLPMEYLGEMRQDLRYAARVLAKSPGYALVGIVSMGLGIGLTTVLYSSGWSLLTRPLAGATHAKRLVTAEKPVSYYYIEQYREHKDLFGGVAAVENGAQFNLGLRGQLSTKTQRVFGQIVSPDYFSVLGMEAQRGRLLSADVDKPGEAPVVVISDQFWRSQLHGDPDMVGQTIRVNGQTATIVGITPRKFDGTLLPNAAELFVPTTAPVALAPELGNDVLQRRNAKEFQALMVLAPGVSVDTAEAALDGITRRLDKLDPMAPAQESKAKRVVLDGAGTRVAIPRTARRAITGFYAALMAIVTAIACLNLATMLLARGANRRRELAIRLGVGASRFRLVRQMVTEGILLSLMGGIAGFGLAYVFEALNAHMRAPAGAPLRPDTTVDWHTAVFAFVLAVVCGIGFSVLPAWQATKTDVAPALKGESALQLSGHKRFGLRNLGMAAQVAGSLMLLLVTGFLVLGFMKSNGLQTNFNKKTMAFLSVDPLRDGYTPKKAEAFFESLQEKLKGSSKVTSFALSAQPPFLSTDDQDDFQMTAEGSHIQRPVARETVGAGYFAALRLPMLAGREFNEADQRANSGDADSDRAVAMPVLLNEKAAHLLFGQDNALGKRLRDDQREYEVVGVVPDTKDADGILQSESYMPLRLRGFGPPPAGGITIIARGHSAADAISGVRDVIASIDPNVTVFNVQTLSEFLELSLAPMRTALRTFGGIGLFGLLLSAIGLAGVTAYSVTQRRKEIGIRMALGARKTQVLRLVLREGATLIAAGSVIGFLGAMALSRALSTVTSDFADAFRVGTDDPRLILGAPLLLAGLALLACYIPARRAARIDPLQALRQD